MASIVALLKHAERVGKGLWLGRTFDKMQHDWRNGLLAWWRKPGVFADEKYFPVNTRM